MLVAWQTVNAVRHPGSRQFTRGSLIVAPGLTIKDRLRVLLPQDPESYYASRELVCAAPEHTWLVECGRQADWGSFDAFVQAVSGAKIEERDATEVVKTGEVPPEVKVFNPVFDATPPEYIDAIITEIGVLPPYATYQVIVKELGYEFMFNED